MHFLALCEWLIYDLRIFGQAGHPITNDGKVILVVICGYYQYTAARQYVSLTAASKHNMGSCCSCAMRV